MATTTRHARGAEEVIDNPWGEKPGHLPTSAEILAWLADADMVVVPQRRLRWFIDKLTDARNSEAERLDVVVHHSFWDSYRETAADPTMSARGVAGIISGIEGSGSC